MNVLHLINNLEREGAQVMVANLVSATDAGPVNYSICVRQPGSQLANDLRARGVEVMEPARYFGFRSTRKSFFFIRQQCIDHRIQVIHAHLADAAILGWLVARKLNLPLVISHHGQDILPTCSPFCRFVYCLLLMLAARSAAMNIAVSSSVADRVRQVLAVNGRRLRVIANGVHIPKAAEVESGVRAGKAGPILISVGRLVPLKRQALLISAMAGIRRRYPDARLILVGDGECMPDLRRQVADFGLDDCVEFAGIVDNVGEYLARADIYLSSSESEGMPVSVLEAMAWGLPVIASDIPGHRSVIDPGKTGFLYESNDIDELVDRVIAVATDRDLAQAVTAGARAMVQERYSDVASERQHAALYRQILQQRPAE